MPLSYPDTSHKSSPSTATHSAAQALADIKKIEKMRANGTLDQYLQELKPKKQTKTKLNKKLLLLLPFPLLILPVFNTHTYELSGRLRNEKAPLRHAQITFHGAQTKETSSDREGKFIVKGVEPGDYKITVQHQNTDPKYAGVETTPLKISVEKDIKTLNVVTRTKMPTQRPQ